jgi:hypothetical protein
MGKRDLANVAHGTEENFRPIKFGSKHILPDFFKKIAHLQIKIGKRGSHFLKLWK